MIHSSWAKVITIGLLTVVFFSGYIYYNDGKKVIQLIEAHTEAMGGKAKWTALKSYQIEMQRADGLTLRLKCLMPNKIALRFQKKDLDLSKIYDGEHGFIIKNGAYQSMRKGETIEMAEEVDYYSELIFALDKGHEVNYLGSEKIVSFKNEKKKEINCHKLSVRKSDRDEQIYWLNKNTQLIEQTGEYSEDASHQGIYYKTQLLDYRSVDGYLFPHKQILIPSNREPVVSTVSKIQVNMIGVKSADFNYEPDNTINLIRYWKDRFQEGRLKAFTFEQETIRTKNDGSMDTSIWYEAIQYPNFFRMDFGDKENLNRNLFRNDSVYVMRKGELVKSGKEIQEFMVMEGAVYDSPLDSTISKLEQLNTDHQLFYQTKYKGRKTYVIGAEEGDLSSNQVWLDAERRNSVRRFSKTKSGKTIEVIYDDFKLIDGHYIETWLEIFVDGELRQTERYNNVKVNPALKQDIFDPQKFKDSYWY